MVNSEKESRAVSISPSSPQSAIIFLDFAPRWWVAWTLHLLTAQTPSLCRHLPYGRSGLASNTHAPRRKIGGHERVGLGPGRDPRRRETEGKKLVGLGRRTGKMDVACRPVWNQAGRPPHFLADCRFINADRNPCGTPSRWPVPLSSPAGTPAATVQGGHDGIPPLVLA